MTIDEFIGIMRHAEPPVPESEVEAFEAEIAARLPEDYRQFLLRVNGGSIPEWGRYRYKGLAPDGRTRSALVSEVGGLRGELGFSLRSNRQFYLAAPGPQPEFETKIPAALLWIMSDPGGNAACLGLTGSHRGKVYRWVHDEPPSEDVWDGEVEHAANIWPLAGSFADFLRGFGPTQEGDAW
jgi:SMI1 / KNR4 family (SUKH-1)